MEEEKRGGEGRGSVEGDEHNESCRVEGGKELKKKEELGMVRRGRRKRW